MHEGQRQRQTQSEQDEMTCHSSRKTSDFSMLELSNCHTVQQHVVVVVVVVVVVDADLQTNVYVHIL